MFITIYGVNNIGKSTQSKMLVESLNNLGKKAVHIKYPIYEIEPSGPYINQILRSGTKQQISEQELQMWFAINRFQFEPQLKQYLSEQYIVVAEDYIATSLAWGSSKGASLPWLEEINKPLLKEDLAILIKGERSINSAENNHIHEQDNVLIGKVAEKLETLSKEHNWKVVDRQEQLEDTQKLIFNIVKNYIN